MAADVDVPTVDEFETPDDVELDEPDVDDWLVPLVVVDEVPAVDVVDDPTDVPVVADAAVEVPRDDVAPAAEVTESARDADVPDAFDSDVPDAFDNDDATAVDDDTASEVPLVAVDAVPVVVDEVEDWDEDVPDCVALPVEVPVEFVFDPPIKARDPDRVSDDVDDDDDDDVSDDEDPVDSDVPTPVD